MTDQVTAANRDDDVSPETKIEDLFDLIDDIEICMMATRLPDGSLVTRPMATEHREDDGRLWFMTSLETHKVDEIQSEPHVNLAYFKDGEWVSVSGTCSVVTDRARIHEMYKPSWKAWLPDQGGEYSGGADDPRIALLEVTPATVMYFKRTTPKPLAVFKLVAAAATGKAPELGEQRSVDAEDFHHFG